MWKNLQNLPQAFKFIKRETLAQAFSCEFCEISKDTFSYRTPPVAASDQRCFVIELFLRILKIFLENTFVAISFSCFLKRDSDTGVFHWILQKDLFDRPHPVAASHPTSSVLLWLCTKQLSGNILTKNKFFFEHLLRSNQPEVFCYKGAFENSTTSEENTCVGVSILIKLQASRPATKVNKRLRHRCFRVSLTKILRATFL